MSFNMVKAVAVSTNAVRVTLSAAALASSSSTIGDALNPNTWVVTRPDFTFTTTQVLDVDGTATIFDVGVLEGFASLLITHNVAATGLLSAALTAIIAPDNENFPGVVSALQPIVQRKLTTVDIANPPNPINTLSVGGTLVILPSGDYDFDSGDTLLKKLIFRRLMTPLGGFFHLPNYGVGLAEKEPLSIPDMIGLKADIDQQCELEPEVAASDCSVSFDNAEGILSVLIRVTQQTSGANLEFTLKAQVI